MIKKTSLRKTKLICEWPLVLIFFFQKPTKLQLFSFCCFVEGGCKMRVFGLFLLVLIAFSLISHACGTRSFLVPYMASLLLTCFVGVAVRLADWHQKKSFRKKELDCRTKCQQTVTGVASTELLSECIAECISPKCFEHYKRNVCIPLPLPPPMQEQNLTSNWAPMRNCLPLAAGARWNRSETRILRRVRVSGDKRISFISKNYWNAEIVIMYFFSMFVKIV